ncbi:MAG: glutathione S-transferase family protein [Gammaproteobacteria bacterium]|nr:glutathione S-transferase family protein [Gammaproteobacteria bacterium]
MSDLVLVIGNKNYSSWSLRSWLLLAESGLDFEEVRIPLDTHVWRREIGRHSPSRKVPVLKHGDITVWESLAICEYLAERFPEIQAWPAALEARAAARSVSAEMHSGFGALRERLPLNCRRRVSGFRVPEDAARDVRRIAQIWRWCREHWGAGGPWLFGEFSIADCMYAPVALRFQTYGVALGKVERDYVDTVVRLPAMQRWLAAAAEEPEVIQDAEVAV